MSASDQNSVSSAANSWPRISLVTPVFNSAKYIEQTIRSVLAQQYPNLEYLIVDGGSTDGTLDIIRKYESQITAWISEPDNGMYDALNKGFARTSGEIMGWISATDQYHVGGLSVVGSVFRNLPDVEWITGRATGFNDDGMTTVVLDLPHWSRYRFLAGANRYIQQESTFWRRTLWEKAGAHVDSSRRNGCDFELWVRFFRHARIYPVDALVGGYRSHPDALGLVGYDECERLHDDYVEADLASAPWGKSLKSFRRLSKSVQAIPKIRGLWQRIVIKGLYCLPGPDWPPVIEHHNDKWVKRGEPGT